MTRDEIEEATISELVMALRTEKPGRGYDRVEDTILARLKNLKGRLDDESDDL